MRFALVLLPAIVSYAQPGYISTYAGAYAGGDFGPAKDAALNRPGHMASDSAGNLYFMENCRVRKIDPQGTITTVAGNGSPGFRGDGGPAIYSQINTDGEPGIGVASDGSVVISDRGNHRIRKITPDGMIRTIAGNGARGFSGDGGTAASATLSGPRGIAIARDESIYVVDQGNIRVRKIDPDGVIRTVVGNGVAGYSGDDGPAELASLSADVRSIAIDRDGVLYIADRSNNCIRKVDRLGIISTIAGGISPGFRGESQPAATALFTGPTSVFVDRGGLVYIGDFSNNRIRVIDQSGIIRTLAGTGVRRQAADGSVAKESPITPALGFTTDPQNALIFTEMLTDRIWKLNQDGRLVAVAGVETSAGQEGALTYSRTVLPIALAFSPSGFLYAAQQTSMIRRVGPTAKWEIVAGTGFPNDPVVEALASQSEIREPRGLAFDEQGRLYFTETFGQQIRAIGDDGLLKTVAGIRNPSSGAYGGDGALATQALLNDPRGLVVSRDGTIYFADTNNTESCASRALNRAKWTPARIRIGILC